MFSNTLLNNSKLHHKRLHGLNKLDELYDLDDLDELDELLAHIQSAR